MIERHPAGYRQGNAAGTKVKVPGMVARIRADGKERRARDGMLPQRGQKRDRTFAGFWQTGHGIGGGTRMGMIRGWKTRDIRNTEGIPDEFPRIRKQRNFFIFGS
jgi:hypothetical protein